jgi:hypothetical protein
MLKNGHRLDVGRQRFGDLLVATDAAGCVVKVKKAQK